MRLLLDTHALLWWATLDPKLTKAAKQAIGDESNEVYLSAASVWEIATKVRLGKLTWPSAAVAVPAYAAEQGFHPLPIALEHADRAGRLELELRDPFDRMLIAQALLENLRLVSNEAVFDRAGVARCW